MTHCMNSPVIRVITGSKGFSSRDNKKAADFIGHYSSSLPLQTGRGSHCVCLLLSSGCIFSLCIQLGTHLRHAVTIYDVQGCVRDMHSMHITRHFYFFFLFPCAVACCFSSYPIFLVLISLLSPVVKFYTMREMTLGCCIFVTGSCFLNANLAFELVQLCSGISICYFHFIIFKF